MQGFTTHKFTSKHINRLLLSFSNVTRGVFISFFGLIINYLLLNYKSQGILDTYVYGISIVNLFLVFANWGGKDYSTKTLTANSDKINEVVRGLINSRLIVFLVLMFVVLFIPTTTPVKIFIAAYLLLKTLNSVFESLIAIQKKFHSFLVIDFLLNLSFILLLIFDRNTTSPELFLTELLVLEFLKLCVNAIFFRKFIHYSINFKEGLNVILSSRTFFYISLAGFICSKADLYVVGSLLDKHEMSRYFILLNLAALSQVCYSTFVSTFSSNIFRYNQKAFANFSAYSAKTGFVFSVAACLAFYFISNYYYKLSLDLTFLALSFLNILLFTFVLTQMYHYTRVSRQKTVVSVLLISGFVNVCLSFVLTYFFGITGAFVSNTACLLCILALLKFYPANGRS